MSVDPNRMLVNASWNEQHSDVKYWLANGADNDDHKNMALSRAVQNHNLPILNTLLEAGADAKSCNLSIAALHESIDVLLALVEAGADPMVEDSEALFNATKFGFSRSVDYLYEKSDVDLVLKNLNSLNEMEPSEVDQPSFAYLSNKRLSELEATQLQSDTRSAAGAWCPTPQQADDFADRMTAQTQSKAQEVPQQQRPRMRL